MVSGLGVETKIAMPTMPTRSSGIHSITAKKYYIRTGCNFIIISGLSVHLCCPRPKNVSVRGGELGIRFWRHAGMVSPRYVPGT